MRNMIGSPLAGSLTLDGAIVVLPMASYALFRKINLGLNNAESTVSSRRWFNMVATFMTWDELNAITGGLSKPGKMPCRAWSIPASKCRTGSKLAKVPGSVCSDCYALKGSYRYGDVQRALERRLKAYLKDPDSWALGMIESIAKTGNPHFRWFDSGDLIDLGHLKRIVAIARALPNVAFWLPTKEKRTLTDFYRFGGILPDNLMVRLSAPMKDARLPLDIYSSEVFTGKDAPEDSVECRAYTQGNKCGDCRACWDDSVARVAYRDH